MKVENFFLVQIKRTKGVIEKGVVVKSDLDSALQSFHAYLGAYAYGNNKDTDYVQVGIKDPNGVDATDTVVWRDDADFAPESGEE